MTEPNGTLAGPLHSSPPEDPNPISQLTSPMTSHSNALDRASHEYGRVAYRLRAWPSATSGTKLARELLELTRSLFKDVVALAGQPIPAGKTPGGKAAAMAVTYTVTFWRACNPSLGGSRLERAFTILTNTLEMMACYLILVERQVPVFERSTAPQARLIEFLAEESYGRGAMLKCMRQTVTTAVRVALGSIPNHEEPDGIEIQNALWREDLAAHCLNLDLGEPTMRLIDSIEGDSARSIQAAGITQLRPRSFAEFAIDMTMRLFLPAAALLIPWYETDRLKIEHTETEEEHEHRLSIEQSVCRHAPSRAPLVASAHLALLTAAGRIAAQELWSVREGTDWNPTRVSKLYDQVAEAIADTIYVLGATMLDRGYSGNPSGFVTLKQLTAHALVAHTRATQKGNSSSNDTSDGKKSYDRQASMNAFEAFTRRDDNEADGSVSSFRPTNWLPGPELNEISESLLERLTTFTKNLQAP